MNTVCSMLSKLFKLRYFTIAILALSVASSCVEGSRKYKQLQAQLDSLQGNYGTQKNQLDEVFATLNEVEAGLSAIREKENILTVESSKDGYDMTQSQKERLQTDISALQGAITQYKEKIEQLKKENKIKSVEFKKRLNAIQKELEEKSETIVKLQSEIQQKNQTIIRKDKQIDSLGRQVTDLQENISNLNTQGEQMKETIATQDRALYSAYYIIGTKDELVEAGVLTKGGLFKSSKVSYQGEKSAFIKIDYREISTINTNSPKAKVLSNHTKGTYTIENVDGEAIITISDPAAFWEHTKYLVIQVQ